MAEMGIYDSGASMHMSLIRDWFLSLRTIPLKPIKAADNTVFHDAMGNMWVSILNGEQSSHIILKDILYFPNLKFTLVSLSQCDLAGYSALLKGQQCHICDMQGTNVRQIPLSGGFYR